MGIGVVLVAYLVLANSAAGPFGGAPTATAVIEQSVTGADPRLDATASERGELAALYRPGNFAPLWIDADGRPTPAADDALGLFSSADAEGLKPADYNSDRLETTAQSLRAGGSPTLEALAAFDMEVSLGMLKYFRHLHTGRVNPRTIGFQMTAPAEQHDFVALVRRAATEGRVLAEAAELTPPLAQYRSLRGMLAQYRALAADRTLGPSQLPKRTVRPGDLYSAALALQHRLAALGDLPAEDPSIDPGLYSESLAAGVKHFQSRHGLTPDGIISDRTRAALEVPLTWRVKQIEFSLERLRWLPDLGDRRLVAINIPMFRLWAWDAVATNPLPTFSSGIIVGRAALNMQTPIFDEEMQYVIFRPYWNVPQSIVRAEILPAIARTPGYLMRQNMEIVRGQTDDADRVDATADALDLLRQGSLRLRQRPGPENALGLVKFVFPNNASVYMHDTPAHELFERARRDFSHGCVRVEDPVGLAEWALKAQPGWDREAIRNGMEGVDNRRVDLAAPIQVILFYMTAAVMPEDSAVHFADDIYGHDTALNRALGDAR